DRKREHRSPGGYALPVARSVWGDARGARTPRDWRRPHAHSRAADTFAGEAACIPRLERRRCEPVGGSRAPRAWMTERFDPSRALEILHRHGVQFVVIGGVAAALHGSSRLTFDLDVCYARDQPNLRALATALRAMNARL